MNEQSRLRLKPQNLLVNLPLAAGYARFASFTA
jgi:hypothetical protein